VKGRLEAWAAELGLREGMPLVREATPTVGAQFDIGRGY
jgi:hypothetical protein